MRLLFVVNMNKFSSGNPPKNKISPSIKLLSSDISKIQSASSTQKYGNSSIFDYQTRLSTTQHQTLRLRVHTDYSLSLFRSTDNTPVFALSQLN